MATAIAIDDFSTGAAREWMCAHQEKRKSKGDVENHKLREYRVRSGSGIGTTVIAVCSCGKKKDVSDYESW